MEELLNQIPRSTAYQLTYFPPGRTFHRGEYQMEFFINDGKKITTHKGTSKSSAIDAIQDAIDKMREEKCQFLK